MTNDFITIKEAKETYKGSFIGTVIKVGEPKSGTTNGRPWTMKVFTVQDKTDSIDITCFGDEVNLFKIGNKYEIIPWWKPKYEGNPNLGIGKYGSVNLIGTDEINNTQPPQVLEPKPMGETRGQLNGEKLPVSSANLLGDVESETIALLQIEKIVVNTMITYSPTITEPNHQKVGMFVKEIYRSIRQPNYKKASET